MARFADRINNKKNKRSDTTSIPSPFASAANSLGGQDAYSIGRLNGVRGQQKITPQTVGAVTGAANPSGVAGIPNAAIVSAITGAAYPKGTTALPNAALVSAITGAAPFLNKEAPASTVQGGGSNGGSYQMESYIPSIDIGDRPSFNSQYMEKLNELAKQLTGMNFGDWTQGEQYRSLADRYSDSGRMGMQNVLGQIAARTGGLASSYASTAAQQQYNSYMSQLEQVARQMYDQDRSDILSDATLYRNLVNDEYGRYREELADYNERLAAAQKAALEAARLAARGSGGKSSSSKKQNSNEDESEGLGNYDAVKNNILMYASRGMGSVGNRIIKQVWNDLNASQQDDLIETLRKKEYSI